jgi:hypothetical protein
MALPDMLQGLARFLYAAIVKTFEMLALEDANLVGDYGHRKASSN